MHGIDKFAVETLHAYNVLIRSQPNKQKTDGIGKLGNNRFLVIQHFRYLFSVSNQSAL